METFLGLWWAVSGQEWLWRFSLSWAHVAGLAKSTIVSQEITVIVSGGTRG